MRNCGLAPLLPRPPTRPCPHQGHSRPRSMVLPPAHRRPPALSEQTEWLPAKLRSFTSPSGICACPAVAPATPMRQHTENPLAQAGGCHAPRRPPPGRATPGQKQSATAKHRVRRAGVHAFDAPLAGAATGGAACSHGVQPAGMCSSRPGQVEAGSECQNRRLEQASKVKSCHAPAKQAGLQS